MSDPPLKDLAIAALADLPKRETAYELTFFLLMLLISIDLTLGVYLLAVLEVVALVSLYRKLGNLLDYPRWTFGSSPRS